MAIPPKPKPTISPAVIANTNAWIAQQGAQSISVAGNIYVGSGRLLPKKLSINIERYFHVEGPAKDVVPILSWIEEQLPDSYTIAEFKNEAPDMSFAVCFDTEEQETKFSLFWRTEN